MIRIVLACWWAFRQRGVLVHRFPDGRWVGIQQVTATTNGTHYLSLAGGWRRFLLHPLVPDRVRSWGASGWVGDSRQVIASFRVPNPYPITNAHWVAAPLPATHIAGPVQVRLDSIEAVTIPPSETYPIPDLRFRFVPRFSLKSTEPPEDGWEATRVELSDPVGNISESLDNPGRRIDEAEPWGKGSFLRQDCLAARRPERIAPDFSACGPV